MASSKMNNTDGIAKLELEVAELRSELSQISVHQDRRFDEVLRAIAGIRKMNYLCDDDADTLMSPPDDSSDNKPPGIENVEDLLLDDHSFKTPKEPHEPRIKGEALSLRDGDSPEVYVIGNLPASPSPPSFRYNLKFNRTASFPVNQVSNEVILPAEVEELIQVSQLPEGVFEKEAERMPAKHILERYAVFRKQATGYIWEAKMHYKFDTPTLCLAINYLDRFLATHKFKRMFHTPTTLHLIGAAVVSLAMRIIGDWIPLNHMQFQILRDPPFRIDAVMIAQMQKTILRSLSWRLVGGGDACDFVDYYLMKMNMNLTTTIDGLEDLMTRARPLVRVALEDEIFWEFRPSEIAASIAICLSLPSLSPYIDKEKVSKCIALLHEAGFVDGDEVDLDGDEVD